MFPPLLEQPRIPAADFLDPLALPESLVEVDQLREYTQLTAQFFGEDFRRLPGLLTGTAVHHLQLQRPQLFGQLANLRGTLRRQRQVQHSLDAVLVVVVGLARAHDDDRGHGIGVPWTCGVGLPRFRAWWLWRAHRAAERYDEKERRPTFPRDRKRPGIVVGGSSEGQFGFGRPHAAEPLGLARTRREVPSRCRISSALPFAAVPRR